MKAATTISSLSTGLLADDALVDGRLAVPHAVGHLAGHVPVLDAKRRRPAGVNHLGRGDLLPLAVPLDLQPHRARIALLERIELGGELEDVVVDRVQGEADHLVLADLGDLQQSGAARSDLGRRVWASKLPHPPLGRLPTKTSSMAETNVVRKHGTAKPFIIRSWCSWRLDQNSIPDPPAGC